MRFAIYLMILSAVGCSNAPLAGTLDCLLPSHAGRGSAGGDRTRDDRLRGDVDPAIPRVDVPTRPTSRENPGRTSDDLPPPARVEDTLRRPSDDGRSLDYNAPLNPPSISN